MKKEVIALISIISISLIISGCVKQECDYFTCTDWSDCIEGIQTRDCTRNSDCPFPQNVKIAIPPEQKDCTEEDCIPDGDLCRLNGNCTDCCSGTSYYEIILNPDCLDPYDLECREIISYFCGKSPEQIDCEQQGGEFIPCFTLSGGYCSLPTSDGGNECTDSSECEAECVAPEGCNAGDLVTGTCAEKTGLTCYGDVMVTVEDGECQPMIIA